MSDDIRQYISDHANAGDCAYAHYQGTHTPAGCPVPAGYCAMIGYTIGLLRLSESRAARSQSPAPAPPLRSFTPPAGAPSPPREDPLTAPVWPPQSTAPQDSSAPGTSYYGGSVSVPCGPGGNGGRM